MFRTDILDKRQGGLALMTYLHLRQDGMDEFEATCKIAELYHPPFSEEQQAILAKAKPVHG